MKLCELCGKPVKTKHRTFCSKSCSISARSAANRGIICAAPECERVGDSASYCEMHYQRLRNGGSLEIRSPWVGLSLTERFWKHVTKLGPDECWIYSGSMSSAGYGQFILKYEGRKAHHVYAHRYSISLVEELRPDAVVLHACDNPPCVNPAHLSQGTQADNMRDAFRKGRMNMDGLALGRSWRKDRQEGGTK